MLATIVSQNSFALVFVGGYRTIIARYVAKWGIAQMCLCESKYQGGGIAPFRGSANLPEKLSRDMGYRSDSIAVSRDMGPLSLQAAVPKTDCPKERRCNAVLLGQMAILWKILGV